MPPIRAVGWPRPEPLPVATAGAAAVAPVTPDPIDVPVPGLVVLIGAAGAGKSTLAARLFEPSEIVSSDALREAVSGDAADQRATRPAFRILHREVSRRLAAGRLVVVDATSVEATARATLRRLAAAARVPAIAIALVPSATEVHARNASRVGRVVPRDIVDRHLGRLGRLGATSAAIAAALLVEGFAAAHVLRSADEIDAVEVQRVATSVSRP
jgi:predicted kinase